MQHPPAQPNMPAHGTACPQRPSHLPYPIPQPPSLYFLGEEEEEKGGGGGVL